MMTLFYAGIAIIFLGTVLYLLRRTRAEEQVKSTPQRDFCNHLGDAQWFKLSERIFDPSDARWLRDELSFPKMAKSLTVVRKQLAIRWLEALHASFAERIRRPDITTSQSTGADSNASWRILWLTVRFQFLLCYALLVVRLFGPYHRLIPSFGWIPSPSGRDSRLRRPALVGGKDFS